MQELAMEAESASYEPLFLNRIVHLDLKGAPPKVSYLAEIFPLFSKLGATGILLEYEDMFPYSGLIKEMAAKNAYDPVTILKINQLAKENNLEIIPLIQTFGHLEFVLKLEEYQHLREVPEQPQAICPSHNETLPVLHLMLEQVANLHPGIQRIHIGADEVYFIGKCSKCQSRISSQFWTPSDLFLDHVTRLASFVADKLQLRPMMWDDQFRSLSESQLLRWQIGSLVDIVVWNYMPTLELRADIWSKYLNVFDSIWAASAFKGATGSDQIVTDISYHVKNHLSWMSLVAEYRNTAHLAKFRGIMITGWQRYDHFAILCELLPVSVPSLAASLLLLQYGHNLARIDEQMSHILQCQENLSTAWSAPEGLTSSSIRCQYSGSDILNAVQYLVQIRDQYNKLLNDSVVRGWISAYNVQHQFSSPTHLEHVSFELVSLRASLEALGRDCQMVFEPVYDRFTVKEWLDTFVKPLLASVDQLARTTDVLRSKNAWPRRPLET